MWSIQCSVQYTVQYLNVRGVVTVVTLPGPHSIEAPDHLPTQVTPGGVVGAHLGQVGMGHGAWGMGHGSCE